MTDTLTSSFCPTKQPMVSIFRNWTYALFYMLSNLWGSVMVSLLFWGFANDITTVEEAKKLAFLHLHICIIFVYSRQLHLGVIKLSPRRFNPSA